MWWGVPMVAVFHWVSITTATLVAFVAPLFLLVLPNPVSLVMAPGIVCRRTPILVEKSVVASPTLVLTSAEDGEIALERFQKFVHNITSGLGPLVVPERIMLTVPTMVMPMPMVINAIS